MTEILKNKLVNIEKYVCNFLTTIHWLVVSQYGVDSNKSSGIILILVSLWNLAV